MLTRLFDANLAAQGYLDLTYVALIVWATALEVERPRRGTPVFVLLALAGLLRPDAWVLAGVYWLWCCWPVVARPRWGRGARPEPLPAGRESAARPEPSPRRLLGYLVLVGIAPVVWVAFDALVTGDPLYSLHSTAVLAAELERTQGFTAVLAATWRYLVRIDKLPVVLGGLAGAVLAVWLTPRRARVPLAVLALLLLVYVAEGAAGASVIDRYMMGAAALLLPFCALAIGGWSLLRAGSRAAPRVDGGRRRASPLRGRRRRLGDEPLERPHHAGLPRRLPRRPRRGAARLPPCAPSSPVARCSRCPTTS